mgnify:CR=1 FL=1
MISWTIEAALGSKYIDKVMVSSDSDEILNISKKQGASIIKRPNDLASDTATSFGAGRHTIYIIDEKFDFVILLQPTSPLRNSMHIDEAFELLIIKKADAVISTCETDHSPLWANTLPKDGSMVSFLKDETLNKRSQDLETYYRLNGAIYVCLIDKLLKNKSFFLKENIFAYKMDREYSVDLDGLMDLKFAEFMIEK